MPCVQNVRRTCNKKSLETSVCGSCNVLLRGRETVGRLPAPEHDFTSKRSSRGCFRSSRNVNNISLRGGQDDGYCNCLLLESHIFTKSTSILIILVVRNQAYISDTMGLFSSNPSPASTAEDGSYKPMKREERKACWDSRDKYFACLDKNNILDSVKDADAAGQKCGKETVAFEKDCASSWVSLRM